MGSSGGGGGVMSGIMGSDPSGHISSAYGSYQAAEGAERSARAAQDAAEAQQRAALASYNETAGIVNPATVKGLQTIEQSLKGQEKNLGRQEQLISQIDPTIIEASQQALKLLRGEDASTLNPLRNQRDLQRQKLVQSLREQMGPGAETSTAGMQALNRFDSETSNMTAGAQQSALQMLGGLSSQFNSVRPNMLAENAGLASIGKMGTDMSFDQARLLSQARAGMIQSAGAEYTGDLLRGQFGQAAGAQMHAAGEQKQSENKQMGMSIAGMFMSDQRAKRDVIPLRRSVFETVPTYAFRYLDSDAWHFGTMAQDLLALDPNHPAVATGADGLYRVDYSKVK